VRHDSGAHQLADEPSKRQAAGGTGDYSPMYRMVEQMPRKDEQFYEAEACWRNCVKAVVNLG
jgi:hypothetical protein